MKADDKLQGTEKFYPTALTIAGSDSGGGAGVQADLRTFSTYGVFGCSVITAVTAQNPAAVTRIDPLPEASITAQIEAVIARFAIGAIKTGMLFDAGIIRAVAQQLEKLSVPLVVDPVMVAGSGAALLQPEAVEAMKEELIPRATVLTPNLPEAELLLGCQITNLKDMAGAAFAAVKKWPCAWIIKGGHAGNDADSCIDIAAIDGKLYKLSAPRVEGDAGHGTGCTFSSALAAGYALGLSWRDNLIAAKALVYGSLAEAVIPGEGLEAMYPPNRNYEKAVKLEKWRE